MKIKIFGKKKCSACKEAKDKIECFLTKWKIENTDMVYYDLDVVDDLAEAASSNALEVPTIIFEDKGQEIVRWEGKVPESKDFKRYFEVGMTGDTNEMDKR